MNEQELLQRIKDIETERKVVVTRMAILKKELLNAESELIHCNLQKEGLVEQLRRLRLATVNHNLTDREEDIERFRSIHQQLLKKISE